MPTNPAVPEPANAALREIAGRLSRLSYRDMLTLADELNAQIGRLSCTHTVDGLAAALLATADTLGSA